MQTEQETLQKQNFFSLMKNLKAEFDDGTPPPGSLLTLQMTKQLSREQQRLVACIIYFGPCFVEHEVSSVQRQKESAESANVTQWVGISKRSSL